MRHNLTLDGIAFRLRPIADTDASLIVDLRNDATRSQYLHPVSDRLSDQLAWLADYYQRPGDYYFAIERLDSKEVEGFISVYDIDFQAACGEWGRWVVKPGSLAAIESAWLIYRCAFEQLALERVWSRTVADNSRAVSFHDSCGIVDRRLLAKHFTLGDTIVDAIEHQVTSTTWRQIAPRLQCMAEATAQIVVRG